MSDIKKYYYLKLKDNYFDQDNIKVLESLPNGHLYSLIILKLYTKACRYNGQLKMTESIPYDPKKVNILAQVINHDKDHVKEAIKCGIELGLITILESGQLWMTEIQNYIGQSSNEADRIREYRSKLSTNVVQLYDKRTPEREREIDIDIEREKEIDIERKLKPKKFISPTFQECIDYNKEKQLNLDVNYFYDYFTTGNWIDSKGNKVRNWKQKMLTWSKHNKQDKQQPSSPPRKIHKAGDPI